MEGEGDDNSSALFTICMLKCVYQKINQPVKEVGEALRDAATLGVHCDLLPLTRDLSHGGGQS